MNFSDWKRGSLACAATLALDNRSALHALHSTCKVSLSALALEWFLLLLGTTDPCIVDPTSMAVFLVRPAMSVATDGRTFAEAAFPLVRCDSPKAWHWGWPQCALPLAQLPGTMVGFPCKKFQLSSDRQPCLTCCCTSPSHSSLQHSTCVNSITPCSPHSFPPHIKAWP